MAKKNRTLALLMALILLFNAISFGASAESASTLNTPSRLMEIESMREKDTETYLMSDGSYQCVVYAYDKYYEAADKTLQLVDNKIVPAKAENRSGKIAAEKAQYKNTANAFDVHFSASGTPEVSVAYQGAAVTFSPIVPTLSGNREAASFSVGKVAAHRALNELTYTGDNTVTYTNAFPNADLVYVLENNALKEYIVLNNANAANTFQFKFSLDGVTLSSKDKYAEFVDANGATVFSLDSLFAIDADGAFTDALTYSFTPKKGTNEVVVTVTLDNTYLSASDRVFPVIIDPTVMISSSETADACVCSYTENTNYQMASQLRTGKDTDYGIRRSFIKFNIPSSIPGGSVTAARIEIEKMSGATPAVRAYMCTTTWSSGTITWKNMPSSGDNYMYQSTLSTPVYNGSAWYKMDVTNIVKYWVNGRFENNGFILQDQTESNTSHWTTWYSSDAPSPHKPELYITYAPLQYTHYYDATVSLNQRAKIPTAVSMSNSAFSRQFGLELSTKSGPIYNSTLTTQDLDIIRISNQLYAYPRDDNELLVFWTDYAPGDYCFHINSTHTGVGCPKFEGLALVYDDRPVIHFTNLVSANGTDYHYEISMALILMHETAHTFAMPEMSERSSHTATGTQCVMGAYPETNPIGVETFYENIKYNGQNAFCNLCHSVLVDLLYS